MIGFRLLILSFSIICLVSSCDFSGHSYIEDEDIKAIESFFSVEDVSIKNTVFVLSDFHYPRVVFFEVTMDEQSYQGIISRKDWYCSNKPISTVSQLESNYMAIKHVREGFSAVFDEYPKADNVYSLDLDDQSNCDLKWKGKIRFSHNNSKLYGVLDLIEK